MRKQSKVSQQASSGLTTGCGAILDELQAIRDELIEEEKRSQSLVDKIHRNHQQSARNLLHYLELRHRDLRPLQMVLASLGLSSLGRAESHVLATINAVIAVLQKLTPREPGDESRHSTINFAEGEQLLNEHTEALFGAVTPGRSVRIMVTMPGDAATNYTLIHDLVKQGMECMRINCAHDDADAWLSMIGHLRRAEKVLGRSCKVVMDLAGPKLRTGPLEPGPAVLRIHPTRDLFGKVTAPARVWLTSLTEPASAPSPADACLHVPADWLTRLKVGQLIRFVDARDAHRSLSIVDHMDTGCWVELSKTAYMAPGILLRYEMGGKKSTAHIGNLPFAENAVHLNVGDPLILTRSLKPGRNAVRDSSGGILTPAMIGCTIPEVFDDVQAGESIWFDDGKIGGVIEKIEDTTVMVRITWTRLQGGKLRADKGINLPDSKLRLASLTEKDLQDLEFIAQHADVVELSFANNAEDVELLQRHLASLGGSSPALVLKIETQRAFEHLPDMLLMAMRSPCCGVMIARGDLAVECGFERLAEVQEEILWICEAAHVPVIWATQVLETLAKEGMPSRAEITDAAMAHRAECVMLNKGPHVLSAVRVLDDILRRMQAHQSKKSAMLRELRLAHTRLNGEGMGD